MAGVARITAALYRLSDHLLHPCISQRPPVHTFRSSCTPSNFELTKKVRQGRPSNCMFSANSPSFGRRQNLQNAPKKSAQRTHCSSSNSGTSIELQFGTSSSTLFSEEQSISDPAHVLRYPFELATPLCEKVGSSIASLTDVCRWRHQAQELATSIGSEFSDADGSPDVTDLWRELEWLLDDVVAACAFRSDDLNIHSKTWKSCSWRDVKDGLIPKLDGDSSLVDSGARGDLAGFALDMSSIYGAFGILCKERHTDPVNEFAADCGCSCDGIRENLAEMASIDELAAETEAGMRSDSDLISRLNQLKDEIHGRANPGLLRTSDLQLLLRMSIDELDKAWKERIQRRRPFQYVVAAAHWRDFILGVVEGVLIPRPETEQIVDLVEAAISDDKFLRQGLWADLGTGSGAIAIALARLLEPPGSVVAIDASTVAVAVAGRNVERYSLQDKVKVLQGFWFSPLHDKPGELAGVISNPPYIPSNNLTSLQAEVGNHEPRIALDGGPDGMNELRKICSGSATALQSGGFLALETNGGDQTEAICDLLSSMRVLESTGIPIGCFRDVKSVKDFAGITRFVTAKRC